MLRAEEWGEKSRFLRCAAEWKCKEAAEWKGKEAAEWKGKEAAEWKGKKLRGENLLILHLRRLAGRLWEVVGRGVG